MGSANGCVMCVLEGDSDPEPACQTIWHCSRSLYIKYFNDVGGSWLWQVSQPHDKDSLINKKVCAHKRARIFKGWRCLEGC